MEATKNKSKGKKKRRPRCVVFDMVPLPPHRSTRPEDNGAMFRRIVLEVNRPQDKRLMVQAIFNGPIDPGFHTLVREFAYGVVTSEAQLTASTPEEAAAIRAAAAKAAAEEEAAASSTTATDSDTDDE